jgi:nitrogen fixation NifU-like protein
MDLYREEILDHYNNPRNFGDLVEPTHTAREANASCGDLIEMALVVRERMVVNKKILIIDEVKFKGIGCALSIATASMLSEKLKGKSVKIAQQMKAKELEELIGVKVSATRLKCVLLPLKAIQRALEGK